MMGEPSRYCDICNAEEMVKIDEDGVYACKYCLKECDWCGNTKACDSYDGEHLCVNCYENDARWCDVCDVLRHYEDGMYVIEGEDMCEHCVQHNVDRGNLIYVEDEGYLWYVNNMEVKG